MSLSYGSYTCIMELILVLRDSYLFYIAYTCISDLRLVLRSIYLSYGSYTYITKHILYVFVYFLYFSCVGLKPILSYHIFHISRRSTGLVLLLSSHILSYVFTYVFMYFHILHCHIIYFHLILFIYVFSFMPVNTKEVDT